MVVYRVRIRQWCSPRDQGLGLEVPRGQNWKSWSWIMKSCSWSWTFSLGLGLAVFKTCCNSWRQWARHAMAFCERQQKQFAIRNRDVNRGSKNRNSLQIRVLKIKFSNSKLDIAFVFLRKLLHKQLETGHLVSAQMARCGITAQRALSTVTPPQRRMDSLRYATSAVIHERS